MARNETTYETENTLLYADTQQRPIGVVTTLTEVVEITEDDGEGTVSTTTKRTVLGTWTNGFEEPQQT